MDQPDLILKPLAEDSATKVLPPATAAEAGHGRMSQESGFPPETQQPLEAGGKAPQRDDMNGALNLLSQHTVFQQAGGRYKFNPALTYDIGHRIALNDGVTEVMSLVDDNAADPNISLGSVWRKAEEAGADAGDIKMTARSTPPQGWLECNGAADLIATYAALDAAIYVGDALNATADWGYRCTDPSNPAGSRSVTGTHIVRPDMRDRFSCGLSNSRPFASAEESRNAAHIHAAMTTAGGAHGHTGTANSAGDHGHSVSGSADLQGGHTHTAPRAENNDVGNGSPNFTTANGVNGTTAATNAAGEHGHNVSGTAANAGAHTHTVTVDSVADHSHAVDVASSGGVDARPRNLAFLCVIKY